MLTETRSTSWVDRALPGYSVAHIPASLDGKAGEGILVAVKRCHSYVVQDWGSNATCLWVKLAFAGSPPLIVGSCYMPPAGSPQLRETPVGERFHELTVDIAAAAVEGYVLVGGDFNAHVTRPVTQVTGFPERMERHLNGHGKHLLEVCCDTDAVLCTGYVAGDTEGLPTFHATMRSRATRPDHMLVSQSLLGHVESSTVLPGFRGSDHLPLVTLIRLPVLVQPHQACHGQPLRQARWHPRGQHCYATALQGAALHHLDACHVAAAQGDVRTAFSELASCVSVAATSSGMPLRACGVRPNANRHKPFFDHECRAMKYRVRALLRREGRSDTFRALEREYHSLVRAKRRVFQKQALEDTLAEQRSNPRSFWKRLRANHKPLPLGLCQVQKWDGYIANVASCPAVSLESLPADSHPTHSPAGASQLNDPLTLLEVLDGLKRLHNGRSPGLCGYPAEFLRAAQATAPHGQPPPPHALAPALLGVLNAAFLSGEVPAVVNSSLITPVFKKGDPADTANYRPIAVGEPIARLYANILNARLVKFTEDNNMRAPSQAGFRPGLSTVHQLFTLQHFIDKGGTQEPLYCCFLDLKSAYDMVSRPALWEVLQRLGVHGQMLAAIQSLYADSDVAVKVEGRCGERVTSSTGVKQGCPLSPTLFGLFVDGLHHYLREKCPEDGPELGDGTRVPDLGYADDFVLMSRTPAGLQRLLNATTDWCTMVNMVISQVKSKVMVFGPPLVPCPDMLVHGERLEWVTSFKYLGILYTSQQGMHATCKQLGKNMTVAWALLRRQYAKLECPAAVGLLLDLYQACVPPTGSYGCEVWAFLPMRPLESADRARLGAAHINMLRQIVGARTTISTAVLFAEIGVEPLDHVWWLRAAKFWNSLAELPPSSLYYRVALDSCADAVGGNVKNWAGTLMKRLLSLGYALTIRSDSLPVIDLDVVRCRLHAQADEVWQELALCPRTCPSEGAARCTYLRWFARPHHASLRLSPLRLPLGARAVRAFLRFRMGCHDLPVDAGRRVRPRVPRENRHCRRCGPPEVGDEQHIVFTCPAVAHIRVKFAHLFQNPSHTMISFMWQADMVSVALFVNECVSYVSDVPVPSNVA